MMRLASIGCLVMESPLTEASPAVGCSRPVIILTVVDLPEPLGPRKPKMDAPGDTEKCQGPLPLPKSPKRLVRPYGLRS